MLCFNAECGAMRRVKEAGDSAENAVLGSMVCRFEPNARGKIAMKKVVWQPVKEE